METIIIPKNKYEDIISDDEEFFDPLIFDTPLILARFIGTIHDLNVQGKKVKAVKLGVTQESLFDYFKKYIYAINFHYTDEAYIDEGGIKFMNEEQRERLFEKKTSLQTFYKGAQIISSPKEPPYSVFIAVEGENIFLYAFSDAENCVVNFRQNDVIPESALDRLRSNILIFLKEG
jgi:hypothetical protein